MHSQVVKRLISWRATISCVAARLQRSKVIAIWCEHCGQWVKPRRYDPNVYACKRCAPQAAHELYRARRAAADAYVAQRRAREKQIREWRGRAAVTTAR